MASITKKAIWLFVATQTTRKIRSTNTSGFKGVSFAKREGKFHAYIMVNGINKSLGYYEDPREAAYAYDAAAQKYFGGFAMTNKELGVL